jgi:hypothetical protein
MRRFAMLTAPRFLRAANGYENPAGSEVSTNLERLAWGPAADQGGPPHFGLARVCVRFRM